MHLATFEECRPMKLKVTHNKLELEELGLNVGLPFALVGENKFPQMLGSNFLLLIFIPTASAKLYITILQVGYVMYTALE